MNVKLSGKVALIAGGTGGLGRAVSLAFLVEDAKVVVTYRKQKEFDVLKKAAGANGSSIEGYCVDVTDEAATSQLVERIVAQYGRLDAVVNAVGATLVGSYGSWIARFSTRCWLRICARAMRWRGRR
jgi:NAD(P)-dependent dehydrogenase (short-subunit alcohol dehydrogenase family)